MATITIEQQLAAAQAEIALLRKKAEVATVVDHAVEQYAKWLRGGGSGLDDTRWQRAHRDALEALGESRR